MKSIYTRVSIRKYQDRPVEKEKTEAILRAAMQAPSAGNQQPWEFYVVTNKEKLAVLSEVSPYAGMTKYAPVAIVAAYRKNCMMPEYAQIDLSIAMEIEKILSIPDNLRAFAIFPYGYPAEERKQQNRFEESRIHYVE